MIRTSATPDQNYVRSVCFSPDDILVAASSEDGTVRVRTSLFHRCFILTMSIGLILYSQVWKVQTQELLHTSRCHTREIYALEFIPTSLRPSSSYEIASSSGDRSINILTFPQTATTGSSSDSADAPEPTCTPLLVADDLQSPNTVITALAVSPDGKYLVSGNLEGHIRLWAWTTTATEDTTKSEWVALVRWQAHEQGVYSVRWANGSGRKLGIVTGSLDMKLKRWSIMLPDEDEVDGRPRAESVLTMMGHKVRFSIFSFVKLAGD